jgi:chorismate mutase
MSIFLQHKPYVIAGPCSAESESQMLEIANALATAPVHMIRAGIWKPRTKPGHFEGMGAVALPWLQMVKEITKKPITIEVATANQIELALKHNVDCLWIGARSTVSPFIVQELADVLQGVQIPVLIKNPVNPDIDLWQGAIERFANAGIKDIGAIHRGFSSYDKSSKYRNKPNWAIPIELRRRMPNIPIITDPSHITGNRELVAYVSQRAMDLHFNGLMIETHPNPEKALSDAAQQITPAVLTALVNALRLPNLISENNTAQEKIDEIRQIIDSLDAEVVDLVARRMHLVEQLAAIKGANNISVFQPQRWQDIIENRSAQGLPLALKKEFIIKLFETIHDQSIKIQFDYLKNNKL